MKDETTAGQCSRGKISSIARRAFVNCSVVRIRDFWGTVVEQEMTPQWLRGSDMVLLEILYKHDVGFLFHLQEQYGVAIGRNIKCRDFEEK
jgi:hypothetical protein